MLGALSYMMLALGSLLAHLLSRVVPWLVGLCVLNVVILVTHFIAIGFFHPGNAYQLCFCDQAN